MTGFASLDGSQSAWWIRAGNGVCCWPRELTSIAGKRTAGAAEPKISSSRRLDPPPARKKSAWARRSDPPPAGSTLARTIQFDPRFPFAGRENVGGHGVYTRCSPQESATPRSIMAKPPPTPTHFRRAGLFVMVLATLDTAWRRYRPEGPKAGCGGGGSFSAVRTDVSHRHGDNAKQSPSGVIAVR